MNTFLKTKEDNIQKALEELNLQDSVVVTQQQDSDFFHLSNHGTSQLPVENLKNNLKVIQSGVEDFEIEQIEQGRYSITFSTV